MAIINDTFDFSLVADQFLAHGSLNNPSFLDGQLVAALALDDISADDWLNRVCAALGVEQPATREAGEVFLVWRTRNQERLAASEMSFEPLLPDEMFSLAERAQSLREWTLGFQEELSSADSEAREGWSRALKDALSDVESISAGLENGIDLDDDNAEDEADLFALADHVRMAALLLYTEQHLGQPDVEKPSDDQLPEGGLEGSLGMSSRQDTH
ncbi:MULTISPECIES: UPF0149 family protein [Cobetia]|uniref:UPF0149 family protein n=1 Tax=Cobetia crustatorum TaxID=553385 RepID=A0A558HS59_9GAMM|nr:MULTISPECIES: UPF0149 family protein [Cobetia]TVU71976.1 UPF0149 family protein [Cobetia crustatorum]